MTVAVFRVAFAIFVALAAICSTVPSAIGFNFASNTGRGRAGVSIDSGARGADELSGPRAPKALSQPVNTAPHTAGKSGAISLTSGLENDPSATTGTREPYAPPSPAFVAGSAVGRSHGVRRDPPGAVVAPAGSSHSFEGGAAWKADTRRILGGTWEGESQRTLPPTAQPKALVGAATDRHLRTLAITIGGELGLDIPVFLALIHDESSWRVRAVGKNGERGLLQLKAGTAKWCGIRDRFDARQNLTCGARYLRAQFDTFHSWEMAIVAFKAGPGSIPDDIPATSWAYAQRTLRKAEAMR